MTKTDELAAVEVRHIKEYCCTQTSCRNCQFGKPWHGNRAEYKCMIGIPCTWEFSQGSQGLVKDLDKEAENEIK